MSTYQTPAKRVYSTRFNGKPPPQLHSGPEMKQGTEQLVERARTRLQILAHAGPRSDGSRTWERLGVRSESVIALSKAGRVDRT